MASKLIVVKDGESIQSAVVAASPGGGHHGYAGNA